MRHGRLLMAALLGACLFSAACDSSQTTTTSQTSSSATATSSVSPVGNNGSPTTNGASGMSGANGMSGSSGSLGNNGGTNGSGGVPGPSGNAGSSGAASGGSTGRVTGGPNSGTNPSPNAGLMANTTSTGGGGGVTSPAPASTKELQVGKGSERVGTILPVTISDKAIDMKLSTPVKTGTVLFQISNQGKSAHNVQLTGVGLLQSLPTPLEPGKQADLQVQMRNGVYSLQLMDEKGVNPVSGVKSATLTVVK
jgi:hypothetical protein